MARVVRNIGFVLAFELVALCVLGSIGVEAVLEDYVFPERSILEQRDYQVLPEFSVESALSGAFQKREEAFLGNRVPMRDGVLLCNAAMQRGAIWLASLARGYDAWPTFFGLPVYYSVRDERLIEGREDIAGVSPAAGLFGRFFLGTLEDAYVVDSAVDYADYCANWMKSDHHWNIDGAYDAYIRIASATGFGNSLVEKGERIVFEKPASYGSLVRMGLTLEVSDWIMDYDFNLGEGSNVSVGSTGGSVYGPTSITALYMKRAIGHRNSLKDDTVSIFKVITARSSSRIRRPIAIGCCCW